MIFDTDFWKTVPQSNDANTGKGNDKRLKGYVAYSFYVALYTLRFERGRDLVDGVLSSQVKVPFVV